MKKKRAVWGAVSVLAIAVAAGGLVAVQTARVDAGRAQACARVTADRSEMGEVVTASEGTPTVAIVGDSYAAGDLLADRSDAWSYRLGKSQGWRTDLVAMGGTGFVNGGYCGDDQIAERVGPAMAGGASTLIIQAGINDAGKPAADIREALREVLSDTQSVERVVLIGPAGSIQRPGSDAVDEIMRAAAAAADREYISTIDWQLEFGPDQLHMTPAGHADYATRVAEQL